MKKFALLVSGFWMIILSACATSKPLVPENLRASTKYEIPEGVDVASIYFNSRDEQCKSPFGAVEQGTEIHLTIYTKPEDFTRIDCTISTQHIQGNSISEKYTEISNIPMVKQDMTNADGFEVWDVYFTLNDIGVYGYQFDMYQTEEIGVIYADNWNTASTHESLDVPWITIKGTGGIGRITPLGKYSLPYTLTVYTNDYGMPDWTDNMVIYYIFPERFRNGNPDNDPVVGERLFYDDLDIEFHSNWCDQKPWVPGKGDGNTTDDSQYCNDFYGGDIEGIIEKLDYIKSLGVNVIYVNPIFKAPSNHKYDTADYLTIDESFGTKETFDELTAEMEARDMHLILDCSLNHCGSDSVYMDRYGKYDSYGAFEDEEIREDSDYYEWFEFKTDWDNPDSAYEQWANPTLANLAEAESYKDFAYRNEDSITKYWLGEGAGGWRMDVTPWVSDEFWVEWRDELKSDYPDAFTVCEVWFDGSKYLYGDKFDSIMNYIFRQALLVFVGGEADGFDAVEALEMIRENYPKPVFYRTMNLLSTHDLPRTLYEMDYDYGDNNYDEAKSRMLLTAAFQFTYPGAPTVYYGDEIGMTGGEDPYNRGPYPWDEYACGYAQDDEIFDTYIQLSTTRQDYDNIFVDGEISMTFTDTNIIVFERWDSDNPAERAVVLFNNAEETVIFIPKGIETGDYVSLVNGETFTYSGVEFFQLDGLSYDILLMSDS